MSADPERSARSDNSERDAFRRLSDLLAELLDLGPEARAALLDRRCAGDAGLRRELEGLLRLDAEGEGPLDRPLGATAASLLGGRPADDAHEPEPETEGRRFGPYVALRRIGAGGMGTVLLAERADGSYESRVAVKLFRAGPELEDHFLRERRILARLEHAGIARLIDGGVTERREPYLVMEWVEGEAIDLYAREHALGLPQRVRLLLAVCEAVAYAHRNLVIHRDLKPSNILVDAEGRTRLLDFGIAKLLDGESGVTTRGLLTPAYAAPEQITGEPETTATDVWALGAILYLLATGERPFGGEGGVEGRLALEHSILAGAVPAPRRRGPVPRDLEAIVLRCLRPAPAERYANADALATDLRRYLAGEAVEARREGAAERVRRWVRRNRLAAAGLALAIAALLGGTATSLWQAHRAQQEEARARLARDFLIGLFYNASPAPGARDDRITARDLLDRSSEQLLGGALRTAPRAESDLLDTLAFIYSRSGTYTPAERLLRRAVEVKRRVLPPDDPETLYSLALLASTLMLEHKTAEADATAQEVLRAVARGAGTPQSHAMALRTAARAHFEAGRPNEAERLLSRARQVYVEGEVEDRGFLAILDAELAESQAAGGWFAEAEASSRRGLEVLRRYPNASREATLILRLAAVLLEEGHSQEAERTLLEAQPRIVSAFAPQNLLVLRGRRLQALAAVRDGRAEEGRSALSALWLEENQDPTESPGLSAEGWLTGVALGEAELGSGREAEAEATLRPLLAAPPPFDSLPWGIERARGRLLLATIAPRTGRLPAAEELLNAADHDLIAPHPFHEEIAKHRAFLRGTRGPS